MSLDTAKLEKVRELAGGIVQARCPACAEGGHDRTGEHLRVYPDGRFGCCVHPKDGDHRKRIFALVGVRKPGTFTLRIKTPPALPSAKSVKAALSTHSLGTPQAELENGVRDVRVVPIDNSRTPRTGISELRTRARGDSTADHIDIGEDSHGELKDLESGVRGVRVTPAGERLPFLTADGSLSIPFDSPERYHWWKPDGERLTVAEIRAEVNHINNPK
jgi:hypothetical protein